MMVNLAVVIQIADDADDDDPDHNHITVRAGPAHQFKARGHRS